MELGCIWFLSIFLQSAYGYTPTFRNEATHPLKAPTESTLGLQINDQSVGRTKSNSAKQEIYFSGGKHFEYMLLNDSNVLLTSLQNDGPLDSPSKLPSLAKDGHFTKLNSSSDESLTPEKIFKCTKSNKNEPTVPVNSEGNNSSKPLLTRNENILNAEEKENNTASNHVNKIQSAVHIPKKKKFNFDKLPDISSTTKLYSKYGNKTEENFASFTSPLVAKPLSGVYGNEEIVSKDSNQTNDSNLHKQNYDYDDSFTRLLISNGILKPENVTNKTEKKYVPVYKPVVYQGQYSNPDRNPSVEDIDRIMDCRVALLIRNSTETKNVISSRVAAFVPDKGTDQKEKTEINIRPFEIAEKISLDKTNVTFDLHTTTNQKFTHAVTEPTSPSLQTIKTSLTDATQPNTNHITDEVTTKLSTITEIVTKALNNSNKLIYSLTGERNEILMAPSSFTQFGQTDTNVPISIPTEQQLKLNVAKLIKDYETTEGKPTSSFVKFAHTDISNENPLFTKSFTNSSETKLTAENDNSFIPKEKIFSNAIIFDNFTKFAKDTSISATIKKPVTTFIKSFSNRKTADKYSSRNYIPLTQFYSFGNLKSSSLKIEKKDYDNNNASKNEERNISVTEFKSLIEKSVRLLFFPIAQYFNNYKDSILRRSSINRNKIIKYFDLDKSKDIKVTLKRFGLTNVIELLKNESKINNFSHGGEKKNSFKTESGLGRSITKNKPFNWTDLNNGNSINLDERVNDLFAENDGDDVHWFVLLLAGNSTIAQMRKEDFVKYLKVNLAARLSLEYNDIKINALIMVPPNLVVNVNLPANESSINVNEELEIERNQKKGSIHDLAETNTTLLELSGQEYQVLQLLSLKSEQSIQSQYLNSRKFVDTKHDDIELYIFVFLGAICTFGILSPVLYGIYRLIQNHTNNLTFKMPSLFGDKFRYQNHEKMNESRCESLNVIFSEDFNRKYSSSSWFDNTQHSSCILKPSTEAPSTFFNEKVNDFPDFNDFVRNGTENSPRLNKENKLNMLSCRPSCVLLPHPSNVYLIRGENEQRYFDNPNYNHDAR